MLAFQVFPYISASHCFSIFFFSSGNRTQRRFTSELHPYLFLTPGLTKLLMLALNLQSPCLSLPSPWNYMTSTTTPDFQHYLWSLDTKESCPEIKIKISWSALIQFINISMHTSISFFYFNLSHSLCLYSFLQSLIFHTLLFTCILRSPCSCFSSLCSKSKRDCRGLI